MGKVPFIYPGRLFGTGAIKVQQRYLSRRKGLVGHTAKGQGGKERGKEEMWPLEIGRIGRSNCLSFSFFCLFPCHLSFLLPLPHFLFSSLFPPSHSLSLPFFLNCPFFLRLPIVVTLLTSGKRVSLVKGKSNQTNAPLDKGRQKPIKSSVTP